MPLIVGHKVTSIYYLPVSLGQKPGFLWLKVSWSLSHGVQQGKDLLSWWLLAVGSVAAGRPWLLARYQSCATWTTLDQLTTWQLVSLRTRASENERDPTWTSDSCCNQSRQWSSIQATQKWEIIKNANTGRGIHTASDSLGFEGGGGALHIDKVSLGVADPAEETI